MSDRWMTLAAAAAALNVHPRTIERRVASGKIQSRRADDGQLQVLIPNAPDEPTRADPLEAVRELAQDQVSLAAGSASAIVRLAQADADRARGELALVRQESGRVRQGARFAWGSVAAMAACVCLAVGWTTYRITASRAEIDALRERAARVETEARALLTERDEARQAAETARLNGAEVNGRLAAYAEQRKALSDKRPATQPTHLLQRIAAVLVGE